jgi:cell division transport system permease protein
MTGNGGIGAIGYFMREGLRSAIKNGVMSLASVSVLTACLLIMGSFLMVSQNIANILSDLEQQNEMVVFLDEALDEERTEEVGEKLKGWRMSAMWSSFPRRTP